MSKALPIPGNEPERVEALHDLNILDTLPEAVYDSITRLAARICDVPVSLISLMDKDRLWFKSKFGIEADQLDREFTICQYTIMQDDVFVVEDALADDRFSDSPLVKQAPKFRFYAGHPIDDLKGHNIGTLCVIGREPRKLSEEQATALRDLSRITTNLILSRRTNAEYEVYRKFFELSLDMLCVAGTDAYFKLLNPAFTRILGWSDQELMSKPFLDYVHKEDIDNTLKEIEKLSEGEPTIAFRNRYRKKDGSYVWMHWNAMPDEKTGEIFAAASDITDVVEANEKLELAIKHKEIFLSNVSHEIRTPMNAIRGFAELLSSSDLDETQRDYLETIMVASDNLLVLINDILDMSKIQSGKIQLDFSPFSIADVVDHITRLNREKALQKGLKIRTDIDEDVPEMVNGDPVRLTQILMNLVTNAIKFTDEGHVGLHIMSEKVGDRTARITFKISDTGIGIPQEDLERIFERFEQVTTDSSRQYGGTGLGLSIVKMLVELHRGSIVVESTVNRGTQFTIRIPYDIPRGEFARRPAKNIGIWKRGLLNGCRILLAEDNEMNQKLVEQFITRNGGEVETAANGGSAVRMLENGAYDAVIMDLQMPVLDGYAATRRIRKKLKLSTPIIACTAHSLAGEKQRCFDEGMNGYVSKPYSERDLVEAILDVLQPDHARTESPTGLKTGRPEPGKGMRDSLEQMEREEGREFVNDLMEIYNKRTPKDIRKLKKALKKKDFEAIRKKAHLVAGSLITLNFSRGYSIAKKLETLVVENRKKEEVADHCSSLINYLEDSLEVTRHYSEE